MAANLFSKEDVCIMDNLKGVAIALIVLFHAGTLRPVVNLFLPFMIPFFVFASGFAFKNGHLIPYTKKLFSLFLLGNLIYLPLAVFRPEHPVVDWPLLLLGPNSVVLWFFPALMVWAVLSKWFVQFRYPFLSALVLSVLLYHATGYISVNDTDSYYGPNFITQASRTVRFFIFFLMGVLVPWERIVALRRLPWRFVGPILVIPFLLCIKRNDYFQVGLVPYWKDLLYLAGGVVFLGSAIALFPGRHMPFLTDLGKASLSVYLLHMLSVKLVLPVMNKVMNAWILPLMPDLHFIRPIVLNSAQLLVIGLSLFLLSRRPVVIWINDQAARIQGLIFRPA